MLCKISQRLKATQPSNTATTDCKNAKQNGICPGWACPILFGAHFGSPLGTIFLFGAHFGSHLGTHLPWDLLGALGPRLGGACGLWRPKADFLGVRGAEPPEILAYFGLFCPIRPLGVILVSEWALAALLAALYPGTHRLARCQWSRMHPKKAQIGPTGPK